MAQLPADPDPPPQPPTPPDDDMCCGGGCNPCVFDRYDAARERYLCELRAWQQRQGGRQSKSGDAQQMAEGLRKAGMPRMPRMPRMPK